MATEELARAVKAKHSPELLQKPGVCGVGVEKDENGNYIIALHLENDNPRLQAELPKELEGVPVKHLFSGPFRAL
jgi:hypothetical protein